MKRRKFLALASATAGYAAAASALQHVRGAATLPPGAREKAETVLRIQPMTLELAPGVNIKTVGYNGHAPGPVLRFKEGAQVNIDVYNETNVADLVHWHGTGLLSIRSTTVPWKKRSPMIPAGGHLRYSFRPRPSGTRWYHTHNTANTRSDTTNRRRPIQGQYMAFSTLSAGTNPETMTRRSFSPFTTGNLI